jgi:hypothetical protein
MLLRRHGIMGPLGQVLLNTLADPTAVLDPRAGYEVTVAPLADGDDAVVTHRVLPAAG